MFSISFLVSFMPVEILQVALAPKIPSWVGLKRWDRNPLEILVTSKTIDDISTETNQQHFFNHRERSKTLQKYIKYELYIRFENGQKSEFSPLKSSNPSASGLRA